MSSAKEDSFLTPDPGPR